MSSIFLQALVENAPTLEGKEFVIEDIYGAIMIVGVKSLRTC
jgi:hypothetical protein